MLGRGPTLYLDEDDLADDTQHTVTLRVTDESGMTDEATVTFDFRESQ